MDRLGLLRIFIAIADNGSLSAAARANAMSPSTVTLALQQLEQLVGARLFTRTTRRIAMTPEGERLLTDSRRILGELDDALEAVAERGELQGVIRVSCVNDFGRSRIAGLIDAFMRLNPGVRIELMLTDAVVDLTEEGYDLGIRTGPLPDSQSLARLLIRGGRQVCAAPEYWKRHGRPAHPRDLSQHNCMVLARPGAPQANWQFHDGGRGFTVRVDGDRTASDGGTLRQWAVAASGVVLKSSFDVAGDIDAGRLEAVLDTYMPEDINLYAVRPAGRRPARRIIALIDYLAENLSAG